MFDYLLPKMKNAITILGLAKNEVSNNEKLDVVIDASNRIVREIEFMRGWKLRLFGTEYKALQEPQLLQLETLRASFAAIFVEVSALKASNNIPDSEIENLEKKLRSHYQTCINHSSQSAPSKWWSSVWNIPDTWTGRIVAIILAALISWGVASCHDQNTKKEQNLRDDQSKKAQIKTQISSYFNDCRDRVSDCQRWGESLCSLSPQNQKVRENLRLEITYTIDGHPTSHLQKNALPWKDIIDGLIENGVTNRASEAKQGIIELRDYFVLDEATGISTNYYSTNGFMPSINKIKSFLDANPQ